VRDHELAARIVLDLFWVWWFLPKEGVSLLDDISANADAITPSMRLEVLALSSVMRFFRGELEQAMDMADTVARRASERDVSARLAALTTRGSILREQDDLKGAVGDHEEALRLAEEIGSEFWSSRSLFSLAQVASRRGHHTEAVQLIERALLIAQGWTQPGMVVELRTELASEALDAGLLTLADEQIHLAMSLIDDDDTPALGPHHLILGRILAMKGELSHAAGRLRHSLRLPALGALENPFLWSYTLAELARVESQRGRNEHALEALVACRLGLEMMGIKPDEPTRRAIAEATEAIGSTFGTAFEQRAAEIARLPFSALIDRVLGDEDEIEVASGVLPEGWVS
jgi:ATP/maltotriose-dependent transcriptional regulator MalT